MKNALIGYTGFVGNTLLRQAQFECLYRSTNINEIENNTFDTIVCAGAPAQKWIANRDPEEDLKKINLLIRHLQYVKCKTFILISTVDVFKNPIGVDENTLIDESGLNPYGLNRRLLEKFVENYFSNHLIIRLPGLVGPCLKKNVIFDFLNNNNIQAIESRGIFQFYPMVNLWSDIKYALDAGLNLVHLTAEPISVAEVSLECFGIIFNQELIGTPSFYDLRTIHSKVFNREGNYQYKKRETIQAIRAYVQSEPLLK
jgi:nucleoside-diphosphate-sugar epimerase